MNPPQKIYCYVDESGQDEGSETFVVAVVLCRKDPRALGMRLLEMEETSGVGRFKWHGAKRARSHTFLELTMTERSAIICIFAGHYKKPTPYFPPMTETIERAIKAAARGPYRAIVLIDGVDKKKAAEFTRELRAHGTCLDHVRSTRDESEPAIRLADRWAGCMRSALLGDKIAEKLVEDAQKKVVSAS